MHKNKLIIMAVLISLSLIPLISTQDLSLVDPVLSICIEQAMEFIEDDTEFMFNMLDDECQGWDEIESLIAHFMDLDLMEFE